MSCGSNGFVGAIGKEDCMDSQLLAKKHVGSAQDDFLLAGTPSTMDEALLKPNVLKLWASPCTTTSAMLPGLASSTPLNNTTPPAQTAAFHHQRTTDLVPRQLLIMQSEQKRNTRLSVATDFALSALKNSFSMSSLSHNWVAGNRTPPSLATTPDGCRVKWERPFNSLNRIKDRGAKSQWRRSFGSSPVASKEDVAGSPCTNQSDWQSNYNYLMDCDLIECCRSLHGELSWDPGDLEFGATSAVKLRSQQKELCPAPLGVSIAPPCPVDVVEMTNTPDLQSKLKILREWLKRMEQRVPKLILKPKWTREVLERRIVEHKLLQREIEGRSSELIAVGRRCAALANCRRLGKALENRYHRLLLRVFEWTYHLETLAKKPPAFWCGRRVALSSPEGEADLPKKYPRLDCKRNRHEVDEVFDESASAAMRQCCGGGLPAPSSGAGEKPSPRTHHHANNIAIFNVKHADSDADEQASSPAADVERSGTPLGLTRSLENSENEWLSNRSRAFNDATRSGGSSAGCLPVPAGVVVAGDEVAGVRKRLSFDSDGDVSESHSWGYRGTSSESDWLQCGGVDLEEEEEEEDDRWDVPIMDADVAVGGIVAAEQVFQGHDEAYSPIYTNEQLRKLVTEAEQMVQSPAELGQKRMPVSDSRNSECDASSELTESEAEFQVRVDDVQQSLTAPEPPAEETKDLPGVAALEPAECSPPAVVVLRNQGRRGKQQRPWSLCGPVIPALTPAGASDRMALSASETALHTMTPVGRRDAKDSLLSPFSDGVGAGAGLSSCSGSGSGGVRPRRRRQSARRRNLLSGRRGGNAASELDAQSGGSEHNLTLASRLSVAASSTSCSDFGDVTPVEHGGGVCSLQPRRSQVTKSTTIAQLTLPAKNYRSPVAPAALLQQTFIKESSSASSPPTSRQATPPKPASVMSTPRSAPSDADIGWCHGDEASNFSEQAWDNYVDRYASEAYSEDPPDAESARRLLEFGEDYRNDLDSLSDCPSSLSTRDPTSQRAQRTICTPHNNNNTIISHAIKRSPMKCLLERSNEKCLLDSDSDVEELVHLLDTSNSQYMTALKTYNKLATSPRWESPQCLELFATCDTNVECLQPIVTSWRMSKSRLDGDKLVSSSKLKAAEELIDKWRNLGSGISSFHREGIRQRELEQKLQTLKSRLGDMETVLNSIPNDDFEQSLKRVRMLRTQIVEQKDLLLRVNVDVHSSMAEETVRFDGCAAIVTKLKTDAMKEDVAGLYQIWDQLSTKVQSKESILEEANATWKVLQQQLQDLQAEIIADQQKLSTYMEQQAPLPQSNTSDASSNVEWWDLWGKGNQQSLQCDSGISSGSDGEFMPLNEREKKLDYLRQLSRKLEAALSPGKHTLSRINEALDKTQEDLQFLQHKFQSIPFINKNAPLPQPIVAQCTTTSQAIIPEQQTSTRSINVRESSAQTDFPMVPICKPRCRPATAVAVAAAAAASAALPSASCQQTTTRIRRRLIPYWWRVFKAALPFHLAVIALIYAACVMEPSCCNYLNHFGSSLVPKLYYLGGPPPI